MWWLCQSQGSTCRLSISEVLMWVECACVQMPLLSEPNEALGPACYDGQQWHREAIPSLKTLSRSTEGILKLLGVMAAAQGIDIWGAIYVIVGASYKRSTSSPYGPAVYLPTPLWRLGAGYLPYGFYTSYIRIFVFYRACAHLSMLVSPESLNHEEGWKIDRLVN
jgi:hypothetical protein